MKSSITYKSRNSLSNEWIKECIELGCEDQDVHFCSIDRLDYKYLPVVTYTIHHIFWSLLFFWIHPLCGSGGGGGVMCISYSTHSYPCIATSPLQPSFFILVHTHNIFYSDTSINFLHLLVLFLFCCVLWLALHNPRLPRIACIHKC